MSFITVKELPALRYLYNNVCNDVTCAGMPVFEHSYLPFILFLYMHKMHKYFCRQLNTDTCAMIPKIKKPNSVYY